MSSRDSPCIGICTLVNDRCIGCNRTIKQIIQAGKDDRQRDSQPDVVDCKGKKIHPDYTDNDCKQIIYRYWRRIGS